MKFFLSSLTILPSQRTAFEALVGKPADDITIAYINNAADVYPEGKRQWVQDYRQTVSDGGYQLEQIDLRAYKGRGDDLRDKLGSKDVVWISGGNTYYLRWVLKDTGADKIIKKLVQNGLVYAGASAGAIVAGPTLQYFQEADDPAKAPEEILDGLKLLDQVVLPHIGSQKYGAVMERTDEYLKADGYVTVRLTDTQALILYDEEAPEIIGVIR